MSTVNEACSEIIEAVNSSGLDFTLNLTPYSVHFSVRRKFSKLSRSTNNLLKITPSRHGLVQQELQYLQSEYEKMSNLYNSEAENNSKLEAELIKQTSDRITAEEELVKDRLASKKEVSDLKASIQNKVVELKQLRDQLENIRKEKNALSIAVKGKNKDLKEANKVYEKEKEVLEKKVIDLQEFKSRKMAEERQEKIRIKKEIKKEKQRTRNIDVTKNVGNIKPTEDVVSDINLNTLRIKTSDEFDDSGEKIAVLENEALDNADIEDVNAMSDNEFMEHMWIKFFGKSRPPKFNDTEEPKPGILIDEQPKI